VAAAGLYLPSKKKASAAESVDAPKASQVTAPASTPTPQQQPPVTQPPVGETQANTTRSKPADIPQKKLIAKNSGPAQADTTASSPAAGAGAAELDAIEHEIDQLTSRAAAVNSGLDNLQRQQAAAGYGLRGDIASKQASMKVNLAKAQNAIEHNDAVRAKRYSDMTATDVEALEKFLGR
jgi:hypothetical protein